MHEISAMIVLRRLFAMVFLAVLVLFAPSLARKAMCTSSRELAEKFPLKRWFIELNGGTCRLAGRRLCNGVCRTSDGMLFSELKGRWGMYAIENNVVRFAGWLAARDIVYIYVQIPAKIDMAGSMLPTGFVHRGNEMAAALLDGLRGGVRTMDLRAMLSTTSGDVARNFYRTDHHWNNDAVFKVFGVIADEVSQALGGDHSLVALYASPSAWKRETWPSCFMGTQSRRTGRAFGGLDDLVVYIPYFHTDMTIDIPSKGIHLSGSFRDTVMWNSAQILRGGSDGFGRDAYSLLYIGGTYGTVRHKNPDAPLKCRLMIIGDSFVRPLEAMLSTVVSDILVLDQRRFAPGETVAGFVESFNPELVLQMNNPSAFGADMLVGPKRRRPVLFEYGELR